MPNHRLVLAGILVSLSASFAEVRPAVAAVDSTSALAGLRAEAKALGPLFRSPLVREFLAATAELPEAGETTVFRDSSGTRYWTEREALELPDTTRARLVRRELDERFYYATRYGSPLAYALALETLADAGWRSARGQRLLDFGYGTIGHLSLLARLGAEAHGVDVDPLLPILYRDEMRWRSPSGPGAISLHHGHWPADSALVREIGSGYDVFLSKNTLKRGYIHPAEKVDPRMLVHLGVDDSAYVRALARAVEPGGFVLIYNLSPAPAPPGKPYIPWADGRCPFDRELWERAGFQALAFDRDDSKRARAMGRALGWDAGERPMDLEKDLFATYSLFRRR